MSYSVTKNTSLLTLASVLQKVISFAYFTLIARIVGVENTGQYFFAIAFTAIFTVVADFGLSPVLTREVAKYPDNAQAYFNTIFGIKILFGGISYLLVIFLVNLLQYPSEIKSLVYLAGVTMFFDNLHSTFYSIFRARKNLFFESLGVVGSQFITLILGSVVLFTGGPMIGLIGAYTVASFCNVIYSGYFLKHFYGLKFIILWDKKLLKMFLALAFPFALAGMISRIYVYADSIIMSKMLETKSLGWWSVPYKISFAFQFIPVALTASVYPAMSSLSLKGGRAIGLLFEKSWKYLLLVSLPISIGIFVLAKQIIVALYGYDYLPAVDVLRVLIIGLVFVFLAFITGASLNATNHQKTQTSILGIALFINIISNLILLPKVGIIGAAFSALLSNIILCGVGYYFISRFIKISHLKILKYFFQVFIPAVLMGIVVYYFSQKINFILTIPIGVIIYLLFIYLFGGITKKDIEDVLIKIK